MKHQRNRKSNGKLHKRYEQTIQSRKPQGLRVYEMFKLTINNRNAKKCNKFYIIPMRVGKNDVQQRKPSTK